MIYPKFIKENDLIAVPAPSDGANTDSKKNKILNSKKNIQNIGYKVKLSQNIFKSNIGRSSSALERAEEFNNMVKDKNVKMILCATGGDFLIEMLPYVDFNLLKDNTKLIAGFSDPTGLLYPITTKYDISTIYGHNFSTFGMEPLHKSHKEFFDIIKGNLTEQNSFDMYENEYVKKATGLEPYNLTDKVYWKTLDNKEISVKGRIIGGCFDIISELAGTKYDGINEFNDKYKSNGLIWYFDNCEKSKEDTIRILWKMNELGYFKYTKCIIFGRFGLDQSFYGYDTKTCLEDSVISKLNIPIIYDADISHKSPCLTIINGSIATVKVKDGKASILFELK